MSTPEEREQIRARLEPQKIKQLGALVPWIIIFLPIFFVVSPIVIFSLKRYFSDDHLGAMVLVPVSALISALLMKVVIRVWKYRLQQEQPDRL